MSERPTPNAGASTLSPLRLRISIILVRRIGVSGAGRNPELLEHLQLVRFGRRIKRQAIEVGPVLWWEWVRVRDGGGMRQGRWRQQGLTFKTALNMGRGAGLTSKTCCVGQGGIESDVSLAHRSDSRGSRE